MQFHWETADNAICRIRVIVSPEEIDRTLTAASQKAGHEGACLSGEQVVDCARKGDSCTVEEQARRELANEAFLSTQAAREKRHLLRVGPVRLLESASIRRGSSHDFTLQFEVLPEITLPEDLHALSVSVQEAIVQPKELRAVLHHLLRMKGSTDPVTEQRLPLDGDILELDVEARSEGKIVWGLCRRRWRLQLRTDTAFPDITGIARSLHTGESGQKKLSCPDNEFFPGLGEKSVELRVTLLSIHRERLPELNDAFAVSLGLKDLASLQEAVYKKSLAIRIDECRHTAEQRLLTALLDNCDFSVPESLVSLHLKKRLLETRQTLLRNGCPAEQVDGELTGLEENMRRQALKTAKAQAFLMALGYREKISVTDEEAEQVLQTILKGNPYRQDLRKQLGEAGILTEIHDELLAKKALHKLYACAKKVVVDREGRRVMTGQVGSWEINANQQN